MCARRASARRWRRARPSSVSASERASEGDAGVPGVARVLRVVVGARGRAFSAGDVAGDDAAVAGEVAEREAAPEPVLAAGLVVGPGDRARLRGDAVADAEVRRLVRAAG